MKSGDSPAMTSCTIGVEVGVGVGVTVGVGVSVAVAVPVDVLVAVGVDVGVKANCAVSSVRLHQTAKTVPMTTKRRNPAQGTESRRRDPPIRSEPHWKQSLARWATRAPQLGHNRSTRCASP